jgi:DNA polymerase III sliding clamp (beta) subunit (PCNA family)
VVEAQAEGRARAVETVAADFEGDEPVIAFNPHYLLDGLAAAAAAGPARAPATPGDGGETPPEPGGRIRIEFTSPAKPALITWAVGRAQDSSEQPGTRAGEQDGGDSGEQPGTGAGGQDDADSAPDDPGSAPEVAAFRYLVVPLRVTAKG